MSEWVPPSIRAELARTICQHCHNAFNPLKAAVVGMEDGKMMIGCPMCGKDSGCKV